MDHHNNHHHIQMIVRDRHDQLRREAAASRLRRAIRTERRRDRHRT